MSVISIRLSEHLLNEVDVYAHKLHLQRTEYIRKAIELMNEQIAAQKRKDRLTKASIRTRKESMKINTEFSRIEHDPEKN